MPSSVASRPLTENDMLKQVSLATAKLLKEAGWPQSGQNAWMLPTDTSPTGEHEFVDYLDSQFWASDDFEELEPFAAPDVSDLLEALPKGVQMTKGLAYGNYYCQDYRERESGAALENEKWQKNPAEALALLWLALKKEKII